MSRAMKLAAIVIVGISALCIAGCAAEKTVKRAVNVPLQKGVEKHLANSRAAVWSVDGKSLSYCSDDKLLQYNTASGREQAITEIGITKSPDAKYIVSDKLVTTGKDAFGPIRMFFLTLIDMQTKCESTIYKTSGYFDKIEWLSNDLILFADRGGRERKTVCVNKTGKIVIYIPQSVLEIAGIDRKGFVYQKMDGSGNYYYDIATKTSKKLPAGIDKAQDYLYLSSKQLVYYQYDESDRFGSALVSAVEFKTMSIHDLRWKLSPGGAMRISPLLDKYWLSHWPRGEWNKPDLYLGDTPPYALKSMREIEAGSL